VGKSGVLVPLHLFRWRQSPGLANTHDWMRAWHELGRSKVWRSLGRSVAVLRSPGDGDKLRPTKSPNVSFGDSKKNHRPAVGMAALACAERGLGVHVCNLTLLTTQVTEFRCNFRHCDLMPMTRWLVYNRPTCFQCGWFNEKMDTSTRYRAFKL